VTATLYRDTGTYFKLIDTLNTSPRRDKRELQAQTTAVANIPEPCMSSKLTVDHREPGVDVGTRLPDIDRMVKSALDKLITLELENALQEGSVSSDGSLVLWRN
jgi:hypothetical protein